MQQDASITGPATGRPPRLVKFALALPLEWPFLCVDEDFVNNPPELAAQRLDAAPLLGQHSRGRRRQVGRPGLAVFRVRAVETNAPLGDVNARPLEREDFGPNAPRR